MASSINDLVLKASETDPSYKSAIEIIEGTRKVSDFVINPLIAYGDGLIIRRTRKRWMYEYTLLYLSYRLVVPLTARAPLMQILWETPREYRPHRIDSTLRLYWWPSIETDFLVFAPQT